MKALVVTNCATAAYTEGLRAIFPQWEIKGAQSDVARKWLYDEPNPVFAEYLGQTEFLVTNEPDDGMFACVPPGSTRLVIPSFYFRAYHPDSFHLDCDGRAVPSVLKSGNLHSRIAATAYILGLPQEDATAAFDARFYERIGYLSVSKTEKAELLNRFAAHRIFLAEDFADWARQGNFLYTYNHPMAFVFKDVLLAALAGRVIDLRLVPQARHALAPVPDFLATSLRWPVYPEIAEHHGFASQMAWHTGQNAGAERLGLEEFVARSYAAFQSCPELAPDHIPGFDQCRDALDG